MLPHSFRRRTGVPTHARCSHCLRRRRVEPKSLLYLEDWRGGVPYAESRYSLGNTALRIAGTTEQYERWRGCTIAIGLTEPAGGSDPA